MYNIKFNPSSLIFLTGYTVSHITICSCCQCCFVLQVAALALLLATGGRSDMSTVLVCNCHLSGENKYMEWP